VQELHVDEFELTTTYTHHSPRLFLPSAPFLPSSPSFLFTIAFLTSPFHFSVPPAISHSSPPSVLPLIYTKTVDSHYKIPRQRSKNATVSGATYG